MGLDVASLTNRIVRRRPQLLGENSMDAARSQETSRNSRQTIVSRGQRDTELGDPNGRQGNDWPSPDVRGGWVIDEVNGQRLQDYANSHLSEQEAPGRIPRLWNDRRLGKVGRGITGNPVGDNSLTLEITGVSAGGEGDGKFMLHQVVPRGLTTARAHARTIDDAVSIPAVYVGDPTRR